ncbi:MAG: hypothetical protein IOD12_02795 [Silvanigrellales bacterium]|nr:hypothetical protein [Silvanigrellales bacterium]
MQQANPKTKRNKRIHFVWFVDASQTKSTSFSLRALAFAGLAGVLFFSAAGAALFLYADEVRSLRLSAEHIKELKTGILAQAMVYEHAITASEREEERNGLAARTRIVEKEIADLGKSAVRLETRNGEEAAALGKVSNSLTNLDNATLNLVAAGAGQEGELAADPGALDASAGVNLSAKTKPLPSPSPLPPLRRSTSDTVVPKTATGAAASQLGTQALPGSKGVELAGGNAVHFENVEVAEATNEAAPNPKADGSNSPFPGASPSPPATRTVVSFQLVNGAPSHPLFGRVCAVAALRGEGGATTYEPFPATLAVSSTQGGSTEPKPGCRGGQIVRFARLRPTAFAFKAPVDRILSVSLYFSTSPNAPFQTYVWKSPTTTAPP